MKIQRQYNILLPSGWLEGTYKNHTKMVVIMMFPIISDTKPTMTTTCEQKKGKYKHQQTKHKAKKHLEIPGLDKLRVGSPHVSLYNGTNYRFLTGGKTKKG